MNYALRTPALNGETVTQGDTNYCRDNGHMTHTIDGAEQGLCPRCGKSNARQKLNDRTAAQSTPILLAALKFMDQTPQADKKPEERLAYATICQVLTERHGLDAKLEDIYENTPLEVRFTYREAIIKAMKN
ncbi:hypothetical protein BSP239C_03160 [Brevibacterium sp. 239c]|uniref:hypothetical protein n=1 Tax=Brevibacterium sp. 239c TaxID=1965356 RepID=UPI000C56A8F5|nr:hypothetical protein [Brevibacterium sp. 239c]SMY00947.1 hypothetical protein BSP239C_03160 [Brevibacterium sp. 239c]